MARPLIAGVAGALLCLGLLAGGALGEKVVEVPTTVTFTNPESGVYVGTVKSNRATCRKGRRVSIVDDRNANGRNDHSDGVLAKTFSGKQGAYKARGSQARTGDRLLIVVAVKVLSRNAFCRSFIKNAVARPE